MLVGIDVFVAAISPDCSILTVPALPLARLTRPLTILLLAINAAIRPSKMQVITPVNMVHLLCETKLQGNKKPMQ